MTAKTGFPPRPVLTASERLANETKIANDRPRFWQRYWRGVLSPRADRLGGRKNVVLNILNAAPKSALDP